MEGSLEEKQTLLRNQILQSGLDGEAFMAFMGIVKNQGQNIDLESWTIAELKSVVQDFKNSIQQQINRQQQRNQSEAMRHSKDKMTNRIMQSLEKKTKVYYDQNDLWDYETHYEQECKKLNKFFQFNDKPEIEYKSWDIKKTGGFIFGMIGAKNQLEITFVTNFTKNQITRKSEDLEWLRKTLIAKFPGSFVPPLETVRAIQPEDKDGIMRIVKSSIFFLNSLLSFDYLVQNSYFNEFITQVDSQKFASFRNRPNISVQTCNIAQIQTTSGFFQVEISHQNLNFIKQSSKYSQFADDAYRNLEVNIRKVLGDMETLTKHLHYLANDFAGLYDQHNKMLSKCGIKTESQKLSSIYAYLNNLFTTVGNSNKKSISILKHLSEDFIKYTHSEWSEFTANHKRCVNQLNTYLSNKYNLLKKKQRSFADISKWELDERETFRMSRVNIQKMNKQDAYEMMYPKDNKLEEQNKIWLCYIHQMYKSSFKFLLKEQEKAFLKNYGQYTFNMERISQIQTDIYKKFGELFLEKNQ